MPIIAPMPFRVLADKVMFFCKKVGTIQASIVKNTIKIYLNIKSIIWTLKKRGQNFYNKIFEIYENIPVSIHS